jgi:hypothetical protein
VNGVANIARCPEHGLHGARSECFICGGAVEQVPMVPCDDAAVERAAEALYELSRGQAWPGVIDGIAVSHVGVKTVAEAVLRAAGESSVV